MRKHLAVLDVLGAMLGVTAWAKPAPFPGIFATPATSTHISTARNGTEYSPEDRAATAKFRRYPLWATFHCVQDRAMPK